MAFTLISFSASAQNRLPQVMVNIIGEYTDQRSVNRSKFINQGLISSDKFKKCKIMTDNFKCLFGINNISEIAHFNLQIFARTYIKEIFVKANPSNSLINRTLKKIKESNNVNNIYHTHKAAFLKIVLKKCKKIIRKSVKYRSLDAKSKIANKYSQNNNKPIPSLYKLIINNIDTLWEY